MYLNLLNGKSINKIYKSLDCNYHLTMSYDGKKQDDKNIKALHEKNLIKIIYNLYLQHSELWDLEDIRRDKSRTDEVRLSAADEVSVANKKRNDLVEQVDKIVSSDLKKFKAWGELVDYRDNQP